MLSCYHREREREREMKYGSKYDRVIDDDDDDDETD